MSHFWDGKTPSPLGEHFSKLGSIRSHRRREGVQEIVTYDV